MAYSYSIVGMQILGQRDTQEDNYIISYVDERETNLRSAPTLIVMADGMGGHAAGDIASRIAVDIFTTHFTKNYHTASEVDLLQSSLDASNAEIRAAAHGNTRKGMGCTFVGALFKQQSMWWVSVGDSHLYLLRNNQIIKKNEDHSYGAYLKHLQAQGKAISNETDQNSNVLLSAMDGGKIERVDLPRLPLELQAGDRIIIASDGLNTLRLGTVLQLSQIYEDTQQYVDMLLREIEVANDPKQDNTTIVVVDVHQADEPAVETTAVDTQQRNFSRIVAMATVLLMVGVGWWFLQPKTRVIEVVDDRDPIINEAGQIIAESEEPGKPPTEPRVEPPITTEPVAVVQPVQPPVEVEPTGVKPPETTTEITTTPPVVTAPPVATIAPSADAPSFWQRFKSLFQPEFQSMPTPILANAPVLPASSSTALSAIRPIQPVVVETAASNASNGTAISPKPRVVMKQKKFRKTLANGQPGPLMITIPDGELLMGTSNTLPYFDERPQHKVAFAAFAISVYEVTLAEYNQFAQASGRALVKAKWPAVNYPVSMISWQEAQAYTQWLTTQTRRTYRLPTEAEWEYVAKAGTTTRFWWGNEVGVGNARCFACEAVLDPGGPAEVDSYQPNPFGVYHVVGNVMEWVSDCYTEDYSQAPRQGNQAQVHPNCDAFVVRGGSFSSPAVRSLAKRTRLHQSTRRDDLGFRVVQELEHSR